MNHLGDYFDTTEGGTMDQPVGSYFDTTPGGELTPAAGAGSYYTPPPPVPVNGSPDGIGGLGSFVDAFPIVSDLRRLRRRRPVSGFGQTETTVESPVSMGPSTGMVVAGVMIGVTLRGVMGYYVGKAMAPSQQAESRYAWWGVPAAIVLGTAGLGIEALVALKNR